MEERKVFFYGKSISLPHLSIYPSDEIPSRDSVIDIKPKPEERKKKGKIQIWKNMWDIKVYGRTILFCVHVSLLSEMDTWTHRPPKGDVKNGILSGLASPFGCGKIPKRFFTFLSIFFEGNKKFPSNLTPSPLRPFMITPAPSRSYFITFQKFIFPWIYLYIFAAVYFY